MYGAYGTCYGIEVTSAPGFALGYFMEYPVIPQGRNYTSRITGMKTWDPPDGMAICLFSPFPPASLRANWSCAGKGG